MTDAKVDFRIPFSHTKLTTEAKRVTIKDTPTTPVILATCIKPKFQNCDTDKDVIMPTNGLSIKNSAIATEAGKAR